MRDYDRELDLQKMALGLPKQLEHRNSFMNSPHPFGELLCELLADPKDKKYTKGLSE